MNKIRILYWTCAAVMFGMLLCLGIRCRNITYGERMLDGYSFLTEYNEKTEELDDGQIRKTYTFEGMPISESGESLMFYSVHQNVEVYVDGDLVHSMKASEDNLFGKTSGSVWNEIPLHSMDSGKEIVVELTAVYGETSDKTPEFYFGNSFDIRKSVYLEDMMAFCLGILTIVAGLVFVIYGMAVYKRVEGGPAVTLIGLFSIFIGMWKVCDLKMTALMLPAYALVLTYIPYVMLLLVVVPFSLYSKQLVDTHKSKIWYVPCVFNFVVVVLEVGLQITDIADMRQTLWMTHVCMLVLALTYLVGVAHEVGRAGWNNKLKATVIFFLICFLGMLADVGIFYWTGGKTSFVGLATYFLYIIVLGAISVKDVNRMVYLGKNAEVYKDLAYNDQLTDLCSRSAYASDMDKACAKANRYTVAMLDLNNLKKCNDTYGHEKGDVYIKGGAELIKETFGKYGQCYRIGGDEFCVLMQKVSEKECEAVKKEFNEKISRWNSEHDEPFSMEIACGYAQFNKDCDFNLYDTIRRADQIMYQEKFRMKAGMQVRA